MSGALLRGAIVCVGCCAWIALASADSPEPSAPVAVVAPAPNAPAPVMVVAPALKAPAPVDALLALSRAHRDGALLVANDAAGRRIELSVVPGLQSRIVRLFGEYQVPYGALVAVEPSSGRVLAYVGHSSANPSAVNLPLDATPPAASVFKLVTSSALIDAGVGPETRVCYGGGASKLQPVDLVDNPRRDGNCASLADALGHSINAVFAKLADRHLDAPTLQRYAAAYGFGRHLPFVVDVPPSPAEIPSERMEFARSAAGFWHVHMSPLHAALIAATLANDGTMPNASLVDRVIEADGRVRTPAREPGRSVVSASTAHAVGKMMLRTVQSGTSRNAFLDARGRPLLPGIDVAGKTGSLSAQDPYRAYSWWIGFAPAEKPTIALAALIVNTATWRIKSSYLAREALHEYLLDEKARR
jgi:penicillin-binding protein A